MIDATLLLALLFCHFLGDFTHLSRPFMLKAKATGLPVWPIFLHAGVHGVLMGIACWILVGPWAALIALGVQIILHTAIDVLKGRMNVWMPSVKDPAKYPHWILFGVDQLAHQAVIIIIIAAL